MQKGLEAGRRWDGETARPTGILQEGMVAVAPSFAFISTSQLAKEAKRYLARRQSTGAERAPMPTTTGAADGRGRGRRDGLTVGRAGRASGNTSSLGHKRQDA